MTSPLTADYMAEMAKSDFKRCKCWFIAKKDGSVVGFTDGSQDIVFNLEQFLTDEALYTDIRVIGSSRINYAAALGFIDSDVASNSDLSVDNLENESLLGPSGYNETDVRSGQWDNAYVIQFEVIPNHLEYGARIVRCGTSGQITIDKTAKVEIRGLLQALQTTIGELTNPLCRAELGDARCQVDLTTFTVTGTIEAVSSDQVTFFDSARTETGPGTSVNITGMTSANPTVVTVDDASGLTDETAGIISGVDGADGVNSIWQIHNLNVGANTFEINDDTTLLDPYVSGGTFSQLGGTSGYFDNGVMTMTSGLANGQSMEVKSFVGGQWTTFLPLPFTVVAGDTYTMIAGCNKTIDECFTKFSNVVNMQAEPYLPGQDKILSAAS